jgi:predicted amidohydrolase
MQNINVAIVSLNCKQGQKEHNLEKIRKWSQKACEQGAELILFPELSICGWPKSSISEIVEEIPGPSTERLADIARQNGCYIAAGLAERDGDTFYDTQVLVGPQGYIGKARKMNPAPGEDEISGGDELPVFDIGKCKISFCLCYDINFPEVCLIPTLKGAELIHVPRAGGPTQKPPEGASASISMMHIARASENKVFVTMANQAGTAQDADGEIMYYPGAAGVISPQGQVLCKFEKQSARTRMLITTLFASLTDGFALREAQTLAEARRYLPKSINGIRDRAIRISKYLEEIIA